MYLLSVLETITGLLQVSALFHPNEACKQMVSNRHVLLRGPMQFCHRYQQDQELPEEKRVKKNKSRGKNKGPAFSHKNHDTNNNDSISTQLIRDNYSSHP